MDVCKPKKVGGLGIRDLRLVNSTLLDKWRRRLFSKACDIWCDILTAKYEATYMTSILGEITGCLWSTSPRWKVFLFWVLKLMTLLIDSELTSLLKLALVYLPPSRRNFGLGIILFVLDSLDFFQFPSRPQTLWGRLVYGRGIGGLGTSSGGDLFSLITSWIFLVIWSLWLETLTFLSRVTYGGDVNRTMVIILCPLRTHVSWVGSSPRSPGLSCRVMSSVYLG